MPSVWGTLSHVVSAITKAAGARDESLMAYPQAGTEQANAASKSLNQFQADAYQPLGVQRNIKEGAQVDLNTQGAVAGFNTLRVMEASAMDGVSNLAKYTALANAMSARVIIRGDENQHGGLHDGLRISSLEQTPQFYKAKFQAREAPVQLKLGKGVQATTRMQIREVVDSDLAATVGKRFIENYEELKAHDFEAPKVGVITATNNDRKAINLEIQVMLRAKGYISDECFKKNHLDDPKLTRAAQRIVSKLVKASVDRLIFRKDYETLGINCGDVLMITGLHIAFNRVTVRNTGGRDVHVNPDWHHCFSPAKAETREYSVGDRVEASAIVRVADQEIEIGTQGGVVAVDEASTSIRWDHGLSTQVNNEQICFVDLAYAYNTYNEHRATRDRWIIALSKVAARDFNQMASYVTATRVKDNTEIVTSDLSTLIRNRYRLSMNTVVRASS